MGYCIKKFALLCAACFSVLAIARSGEPPRQPLQNLAVAGKEFTVYRVDPKVQKLDLYWKNPNGEIYGSFGKLNRSLRARGLRLDFATNAGIFEEGYIPTGLLMIGGKDILPLNLNPGKGNFFLEPNGVFLYSRGKPFLMTSKDWLQFKHPIDFANQSGPMLVIGGKIHPVFDPSSKSLYIRNGVGIDDKGMVCFAISRQPVSLHAFASLFKDQLRCKNALYLDGSISKFYLPGVPRISEASEKFAAIFAVTSPL